MIAVLPLAVLSAAVLSDAARRGVHERPAHRRIVYLRNRGYRKTREERWPRDSARFDLDLYTEAIKIHYTLQTRQVELEESAKRLEKTLRAEGKHEAANTVAGLAALYREQRRLLEELAESLAHEARENE